MKAITVGIFSAFVYSFVVWAIARMNDLNLDLVSVGVVKSTVYSLVVAFPIGLAAHIVVAFFGGKIFFMIPMAFGIGLMVAVGFHFLDGAKEGQLMNILAFSGMPLIFSIPYSLILNQNVEPDSAASSAKPGG